MMSTAGVVLPKAIQEQLDAAERLLQPEPEPTPEVVAQPEPEPTPQPEVQPEPQPTPAPVVQAEPQQEARYWEQRFKTLEGMNRAETGQLRQELARAQAQIEALMQRQQTSQPAEPKAEPLITPKDEDKFGADLIDVARRSAQEVFRAESQEFLRRLVAIEQAVQRVAPQVERVAQVEQRVAQTQEMTFYGELEKAVPDWQTVNGDSRWLAWLDEVEPMVGVKRQMLLDEAHRALDHKRVAAMFSLFKQTLPQPAKQQKPQVSPELARQVAPSKSSTVTAQAPQPEMFTGTQYQYWIHPRRTTDTDKVKLAQMLDLLERAEVEGRIDWTK